VFQQAAVGLEDDQGGGDEGPDGSLLPGDRPPTELQGHRCRQGNQVCEQWVGGSMPVR